MTDREILTRLAALEQRSVQVYESLLFGTVKPRGVGAISTFELFLNHERRHLEDLTLALRNTGASPPRKLPRARPPQGGSRDLIRFALRHEQECIRSFQKALVDLKAPAVLSTVAGIMGNQAQHLAFLRQLLGEEPAPVAFVTGRD